MTSRKELLADFGFDPEDPQVKAALEDAETYARLVETLVGHRNRCQIPQSVVAERMGTTQSRVSSFERLGGDPRLSTIQRYARAVDAKIKVVVATVPAGWREAETVHIEAASPVHTSDLPKGDWVEVASVAG